MLCWHTLGLSQRRKNEGPARLAPLSVSLLRAFKCGEALPAPSAHLLSDLLTMFLVPLFLIVCVGVCVCVRVCVCFFLFFGCFPGAVSAM